MFHAKATDDGCAVYKYDNNYTSQGTKSQIICKALQCRHLCTLRLPSWTSASVTSVWSVNKQSCELALYKSLLAFMVTNEYLKLFFVSCTNVVSRRPVVYVAACFHLCSKGEDSLEEANLSSKC